jgi:hypothetical protein
LWLGRGNNNAKLPLRGTSADSCVISSNYFPVTVSTENGFSQGCFRFCGFVYKTVNTTFFVNYTILQHLTVSQIRPCAFSQIGD